VTNEQERHLARVLRSFVFKADAKYRKGQEEHGGDLWALSAIDLVNHALEEAIDQVVYLDTLRENLINEQQAKVIK